jgi:Uma2 family endonuclease
MGGSRDGAGCYDSGNVSRRAGWEVRVSNGRASVKYTYEDLQTFPEGDGKRYEIIHGDLFVSPAPMRKHQLVLGNFFGLLWVFLKGNPIGEVLFAPFDVVLSDIDVVEPDLLFVSNARLDRLTRKNAQGAPDLVVEVLSKSTRRTDETRKRRLYESVDVLEYWIVDPELETLKVYRKAGERFDRPIELSSEAGDTLTTPLLPGFAVPLAKLFT